MKSFLSVSGSAIFWVWNLTFLLIVYVGILPNIAPALLQDALIEEVPFTILVSLLGLILVPTFCTILGGLKLRNRPALLLRLFYGIEAPLFTLCLLRLFVIRELTPASTQILGTIALCIFAFALELLSGYAARRPVLAWFQMLSHSLMLIVGVYLGVLLTLYTVPAFCITVFALCIFLYNFFQFEWLQYLGDLLTTQRLDITLMGGGILLLFGLSATLFFIMPFAMVNLFTRSWMRIAAAFGAQYGQRRAIASTAGVAIAWFLVFMSLQQQPQIEAFKRLEQPTQGDRTRQELLAKSDTIRAGLVNAYLSSYRYLSPWQESNQLREMYRSVFGLSQPQAQFWQDFHNHWLSPFLYNGSRNDADRAAQLYAQFFDAPIQKAEQQAVQRALQATANRDETQAGLVNINQRIVWLAQQQVTVQEHGDWAAIELYEQYENPTGDDQEIFYSFSLPESAVITGLWLGDTSDLEKRFRFTVSPRGAAQQVYKGEVERSSRAAAEDPALIEQVGPRQYRLRVFPIPARQVTETARTQPGQLHLWMTYQVMRQDQGWALPQLSEKRNIFWTDKTVRRRNGRSPQLKDQWLEAALPAQSHRPEPHQVNLPGGDRLTAQPLNSSDYRLPEAKRFALVLDRSRSMASHTRELTETVRWLNRAGARNDIDLYLTASPGGNPKRIDDLRQFKPTQTVFYGSLHIPQMLGQFAQLQGNTAYDAILLLTDEGSYELSKDNAELPALSAPLWAVHLGGLPPAYDDATLQSIQKTRGGVATGIQEAMQRLATEAALGQSVASVADGYAWRVEEQAGKDKERAARGNDQSLSPSDQINLVPIASRQLILKLSRQQDMTQLAELDRVHQIAKSAEIVTPYSSMLVLVNDRQRELLRQAEAGGDRFHREVENGQDNLTQPNNLLNVTSVPEPSAVVGLGGVAIALLFVARRHPKNR
jgi:putative PEP-CTERM system integral membrane protein